MKEVLLGVGGLLAALGGFTGIASLVESFRSRGKDKADEKAVEATAAQVLTNAATGLLKPLQDQVDWLVQRDTEREQEARSLRVEIRSLRDKDRERDLSDRVRDDMGLDHMEWDRTVVEKVRVLVRLLTKTLAGDRLNPEEQGLATDDLPDPPPLFPPAVP